MTDHEFSEDDVARYWNDNAAPWAQEVRRGEEPRPSEEYCLAHPSQRGWRDHAALFLHVRAEKPAP